MRVRTVEPDDWVAVTLLLETCSATALQLWSWEEYLTEDVFLVVEGEWGLRAAFLAWADVPPVAWVRMAVVEEALGVGIWLDHTLPLAIEALRRRRSRRLMWLDYHGWAAPHLAQRGFFPLTDVCVLAKMDRYLPAGGDGEVAIRAACPDDLSAIVSVDHAAFAPLWWYSAASLGQRLADASLFLVAESSDQLVGYAEGVFQGVHAHINRIAVRPSMQGQGVGSSLLRRALELFWRRDVEEVSLNTQIDNHPSQRLYRRFGFAPTGEEATVWSRIL